MKYFQRTLPLLLPFLHISPAVADYESNAEQAIKTLQDRWYDTNTGLWNRLWWQSGNMVSTIALFGQHDEHFKPTAINIVANTFAKGASGNGGSWLNDYYDDEGWWALGWIDSFDLTGDRKYLDAAKSIFEDMTGGWTDSPCGGGIFWSKQRQNLAAIANELFLSIAAHLANRSQGQERQNYINWAKREWEWFYHSGVINGQNTINDGVDFKTCKNDGKTVYTYNQGVILGGLAELARATGDGEHIKNAKKIADGALAHLTQDGGILTEIPVRLDEQGAQFKGVFVRGLAKLYPQAPEGRYATFLKKNADTMWSKNRANDGVLGARWQGPVQDAGTTSHAAGVDLLVAVAKVA
ncbi:glycoside hydrolase family 76 protein [Amniculicola lignicola CBS 123094]|uniref:Glycoside hydrolase family 76 protein n=1 Tax=Amniculicola lignicola CBS 123094 TaxID=1392246 RepID=A0A6A5WUD8_9PLEO|nr:glycoside hydrolase family 76 protein [Amniculicola lignicola CBS 123094]